MTLITRRAWLFLIPAAALSCRNSQPGADKANQQLQVETVTLAVDGMI